MCRIDIQPCISFKVTEEVEQVDFHGEGCGVGVERVELRN